MYYGFHKILSSTTVFNMISEGSCVTEDWSDDDCWHHRKKLHNKYIHVTGAQLLW